MSDCVAGLLQQRSHRSVLHPIKCIEHVRGHGAAVRINSAELLGQSDHLGLALTFCPVREIPVG